MCAAVGFRRPGLATGRPGPIATRIAAAFSDAVVQPRVVRSPRSASANERSPTSGLLDGFGEGQLPKVDWSFAQKIAAVSFGSVSDGQSHELTAGQPTFNLRHS